MPKGSKKLEIDLAEVEQLMNASKNKDEFRSFQALYLRVKENMSAPSIAKITCFSVSHVHSIHSLARLKGIAIGRSPISICGGAIWFTSQLLGQPKPLKEVSQVAGVSEGTIKLVYRSFVDHKERLVNAKLLESGKADFSRLTMVN